MTFDATISLGNIITWFGIILFVWVRFTRLEQQVALLWAWFKKVHHISGDDRPEGPLWRPPMN